MSTTDYIEKRDMDILLVEDDQFVRETLQILIRSFGYECDTAANGFDAVEKLKEKKFDVVVTDVSMPEMDGL